MDRKDFFKRACLTSACFCGFGIASSVVSASNISYKEEYSIQNEWLADLLSNLDSGIDKHTLRSIIKKSSEIHYQQLRMDEFLSPYVGDLDAFIKFIEQKWGWKITYDRNKGVLIADENKPNCVCPVLPLMRENKASAICFCSEGFAEKMFSFVANKPVYAEVKSSVRRGDSTCVYQIKI
nr:hypothetical protein [uncultured Carboxylicivirga sp.]